MMQPADRPLFRQDLLAEQVDEQGTKYIDVGDPDSGQVFRFYEAELSIACGMDGQRDIAGLVRWAADELGLKTTPQEVKNLIGTLSSHGFLEHGRDVVHPQPRPSADPELAAGIVVTAPSKPAASIDLEMGPAGNRAKPADKAAPKAPELELGPSTAAAKSARITVEDVPLGAPGKSTTEPSAPVSTDISLDLSDQVAIGRNEVKEAIRQSRVMTAVEVPPDLADALDDKVPPKAATAEKPAEKPVVAPPATKQPEKVADTKAAAVATPVATPATKQPEKAADTKAADATKQPEKAADAKAADTKAADKAADKKAADAKAADAKAADTKATDKKAADTKAADKAADKKAADKAADTKAADTKAADKKADGKAADKKADGKAADKKTDGNAESKTDGKPGEKKPGEKKPDLQKTAEKQPVKPDAPKKGVSPLLVILVLLILGGGGFALWKFVLNKSDDAQQTGGVVPTAPSQPVAAVGSGATPASNVLEEPIVRSAPTAKFVNETPPERQIMSIHNGRLEWVEKPGKDVTSGTVVAKLVGAARLENEIKNLQAQMDRVKRELEAATKDRDNAQAAGNPAAVTTAERKVQDRQSSLDKKSEDVEKKKEELERFRIYAFNDGKLTAVSKIGTVIGDTTEVARIQPVNRITATFPLDTQMEKGIAVVVYVTEGNKEPITCKVLESREAEIKVGECQGDKIVDGQLARLHLSE